LKTMNILVTGGAGFIGSRVCEKLISFGHKVICVDNFNDYYNPQIKESNISELRKNPSFLLFRDDILKNELLEYIFLNNSIDIVIHLAARAGVRPSIDNARLYEEVNVRGTINLLECCKKFGVRRFVFASSSSVYGGNKKVPFSEDDTVDHPVSPYAATKKAGELICYTYSHLFELNIFCYRFFTVYGPRQRPEMAIHKFTGLVLSGKPIDVYGDGMSSRDYTYIDDITDAITGSLDTIKGYGIFNLGNSRPVGLAELVGLIESATGKKAIINRMDFQPGDVQTTFADITKAKKMLNYNPATPIESGIAKFVEWYKKKQEI
jgi:UDP-glucuronate 4-epimerase